MASSLATTSAAATTSTNLAHYKTNNNTYKHNCLSNVSFRLSPKPKLRFFSKGWQPSRNCSTVVKGQLDEVRFFKWFSLEDHFSNFLSFLDMLLGSSVAFKVDGSSNVAATAPRELELPAQESKDRKTSNESCPAVLDTEESISEFIAQVASLVKLVDSRDIVELQLKQLDFEVIIRKKEALPQPPVPAPVPMMQAAPPPVAPAAPASSSAPSSPPATFPAPSSPNAKSAKTSLPPLKCPMAGIFYRSPAPGEPPLVKVGDKIQKGQVLCIIEAMKLMNEIEADQSGTVVEILVEDGKPVSVDMPLFVIQP
ncbi:PREDICTED: biotin carboxyl carrier [Prunus dulcis]|uniref:Biotin carboxyl carrier protein of acetyl-CoA carboxylase n=1 Tax=Prunus dulcis TaxID=3755 RepID=A0A5E4FLA8_PRUDU|nr:biotin carboxyl carrier protein of acetyl-CoA carboxylase 1, chloroplastic isoform X1 [Prunus dulcis]VVA26488.1 PREDICTED: biotin carboxyl carrier [Prunus dulcis]